MVAQRTGPPDIAYTNGSRALYALSGKRAGGVDPPSCADALRNRRVFFGGQRVELVVGGIGGIDVGGPGGAAVCAAIRR